MKREIRELDALTVNQIAAGEVVERPLSVVKELVENAIDAEADAITVEIAEGGLTLIRVTDNGIGMEASEVKKAFGRHFTSKLHTIEDLHTITSLGFRGEALAAIAGVSEIEVITKTEGSFTATRYVLEGIQEKALEEVGAPKGTTMIVRNLFFNTPARKKFLKSDKTEASYVFELLQRLALAYRGISFKLIVDGKAKLQTNGDGDLQAAILYIFGTETAKRLKAVHHEERGIRISGFVGTPELNRGNRNYEIYFVNGRFVKNKWIQQGLEEGSFGYLMQHQFPFSVLEIEIEGEKLDVNVHPQKAEVRFENPYLVQEAVKEAVMEAFREKESIPAVALTEHKRAFQVDEKAKEQYSKAEPFELKRKEMAAVAEIRERGDMPNPMPEIRERPERQAVIAKIPITPMKKDKAGDTAEPLSEQEMLMPAESMPTEQMEFVSLQSVKSHRVIGQIFDTYWMIEFQNALYIVDQHAAHEKVLYEKLVKAFNADQIQSQRLLEPFLVGVSHTEMQNFLKAEGFFKKLGFDAEPFGEDMIRVIGIPYVFQKTMQKEEFRLLLDKMDEKKWQNNAETIDHELATIACKAAVKAHDKLSVREYEALMDELLKLENPYHCPHGRPTLIKMTRYELDRKFKRVL